MDLSFNEGPLIEAIERVKKAAREAQWSSASLQALLMKRNRIKVKQIALKYFNLVSIDEDIDPELATVVVRVTVQGDKAQDQPCWEELSATFPGIGFVIWRTRG